MPPTRADLRSRLDGLELDDFLALCQDHFNSVHAKFAPGMTRDQQTSLLIDHVFRNEKVSELERLLSPTDGKAGGVPRQIPSPPADFVGRADELAAQPGGVAISALSGQGGIGKTALALKLAERLAAGHPDGQLFFDLGGYSGQPRPWQDAASHVVRTFTSPDYRVPDDDALQQNYCDVLAGKRVLLLLDNARDAAHVKPLLPPAGVTLLVTSRRRLTLPGLRLYDLDTLPQTDAVTLLRSLAGRLTEAEAGELAKECGRLPLALRLTGSLLAVREDLSPARYLERLRAGRLAELDAAAALTEADVTLTQTIRLSEEYMLEPVRTRWRELAVLVERFALSWAAGVWSVDERTAEDWLGLLRINSVLDWDDATKTYRLHDLVRDYGRDKMPEPEWMEAARRHAHYFVAETEETLKLYSRGGGALLEGLQRFYRAWPQLHAAFEWARARTEDRDAQQVCVDLPGWVVHLLETYPAALAPATPFRLLSLT